MKFCLPVKSAKYQLGVYFSLAPFVITIFGFLLLFAVDFALSFLAQKEAQNITERIGEAAVNILVSRLSDPTVRLNDQNCNDVINVIREGIRELYNQNRFVFLVTPQLDDNDQNSIAVRLRVENIPVSSNKPLIEVILGVAYPKGESFRSVPCNDDRGCWQPLEGGPGSLQSVGTCIENLMRVNSARVRFNLSSTARPLSVVSSIFYDPSSTIKAEIFASVRPRVVFNLGDFSWSTFEGPTQFTRRGRWAQLPHYELASTQGSGITSGVDCAPELDAGQTTENSHRLKEKKCEFKGLGEQIWNAMHYQAPFNTDRPPFILREVDTGLCFIRQSLNQQENDFYVLNILDESLNTAQCPVNQFLIHHAKEHLEIINDVNKRSGSAVRDNRHPLFDSENITLNTPRIYHWSAPSPNPLSSGVTGEASSAVRSELFDTYFLNSIRNSGTLSQKFSQTNFLWNAQCFYGIPWTCLTFNNHGALLAFELRRNGNNQLTPFADYRWPHIFKGVVRPTYCHSNTNSDNCRFDHFRRNDPLKSIGHTGDGEAALQSLPMWIFNSHDGGVYRRYSDIVMPTSNAECCFLKGENEVMCYRPFSAVFRRRGENGNIIDSYSVQFCEGAPEMGGLIVWPEAGWFNFKSVSTNSERGVVFRLENSSTNNTYYLWEIRFGHQDSGLGENQNNFPRFCGNPVITDREIWFKNCSRLQSSVEYRVTDLRNDIIIENNQVFYLRRRVSYFNPRPYDWDYSIKRYLIYDTTGNRNVLEIVNPGYATSVSERFSEILTRYGCTLNNKKACIMITYESTPFNGFQKNFEETTTVNNSNFTTRTVRPLTTYLSKFIGGNRYMSDYQPHSVNGLRNINVTISNNSLSFQVGQPNSFNLLIEDPQWLRKLGDEGYFNPQTATPLSTSNNNSGNNNDRWTGCANVDWGNDIASPSACPYQVGLHPKIRLNLCENRTRGDRDTVYFMCLYNQGNDNTPGLTSRANTRDTHFVSGVTSMKLSYPWFLWQNYEGPQPISGILQGIALMHDLLVRKYRIPGDRFGLMPLLGDLGYTRSFIPPTEPIFQDVSNIIFPDVNELADEQVIPSQTSKIQNRLRAFLAATHPEKVRGEEFHSFERVRHRYTLGLFPSIDEVGETNLVWSLAVAGRYLRDLARFNQVILPVFTDLIALGTCNLVNQTGDFRLSWEDIDRCIQTPNNRVSFTQAIQTASTYNQWIGELMYNLTGDPSYDTSNSRPRHEGIIRFLARNNIIPVFFVFNGTAGGYPILRDQNNSCIFMRKELKSKGYPTAFNKSFDESFNINAGESIRLARRSGGYGNVYAYIFGDLEPIFREIGSEFVQILPRCQPAHDGQNTNNVQTSIIARINQFCAQNSSRNLTGVGNLNPTHYSQGLAHFGLCGHIRERDDTNFPHFGWRSIQSAAWNFLSCLAFDFSSTRATVRFGAGLFNLGHDLNMPSEQQYDKDINIRPDVIDQTTLYNFGDMLLIGRTRDFQLTFMPYISISVAGGLRCHPTLDIERQIEEVLAEILRRPKISVVRNYRIVNVPAVQNLPGSNIPVIGGGTGEPNAIE